MSFHFTNTTCIEILHRPLWFFSYPNTALLSLLLLFFCCWTVRTSQPTYVQQCNLSIITARLLFSPTKSTNSLACFASPACVRVSVCVYCWRFTRFTGHALRGYLMAFTGCCQSDADSALVLSGIYTGKKEWGGASRVEKSGKGSSHALYLMRWKKGNETLPDGNTVILTDVLLPFDSKISLRFSTPTLTVFQTLSAGITWCLHHFFLIFIYFLG